MAGWYTIHESHSMLLQAYAVTNNYVPNITLLAGELAGATDINLRYGYVVSGFDKLPTPLSGGGSFCSSSGWRAHSGVHAATKEYMDTTVVSAAQTAQSLRQRQQLSQRLRQKWQRLLQQPHLQILLRHRLDQRPPPAIMWRRH